MVVIVGTVDDPGWVTVLVTVVVLGMSDVKTPEAISIKENIQEDEDVLVEPPWVTVTSSVDVTTSVFVSVIV